MIAQYTINNKFTAGIDEVGRKLEQIRYPYPGSYNSSVSDPDLPLDDDAFKKHSYNQGHLITEKDEPGAIVKLFEIFARRRI